jgi:hypothetical protein
MALTGATVKDSKGVENLLCSQPNLTSRNSYNATIDVNLCSDSGAREAVFGNTGLGLGIGTAEEVDCSEYKGTKTGPGVGSTSTSASLTGASSSGTATGTGKAGGPKSGEASGRMEDGLVGSLVMGFAVVLGEGLGLL